MIFENSTVAQHEDNDFNLGSNQNVVDKKTNPNRTTVRKAGQLLQKKF
jgi:hypothetical protein